MKNSWKIAMILALAICLVVALISCENEGDGYVYVTDTNGETVTDTDGTPVTAADTNNDGVADESQTDDNGKVTTASTGISAGGANDESGWGKIITPNK